MRRVFITGTAGFIGFHLARQLLDAGWRVYGFDGMTDYYDVALKHSRQNILLAHPNFSTTTAQLEDAHAVARALTDAAPEAVVHLAAQAGVRYSLEAPRSYIDSNVTGTLNVIEAAQRAGVAHLLMASSSSVYGGNTRLPFRETDQTQLPLSIYAATKAATEDLGHAYAHLYNLPVTCFRFFTVYGSWSRPDLAPFKFARAILSGQPIDVYNHGDMYRDFTFVGDLVRAVELLIDCPPPAPGAARIDGDSLSPVAPWRAINIGNSNKVRLTDFIDALETALAVPATRNLMPMQPGDVPATWADAELLHALTGYRPDTKLRDGIISFVDWFRDYHHIPA
ncbi:GDP-mannose 4,6-dehydratase [Paracoccus sp. (in: a-proteobacteria)]|uniref:NAD-dependent epimerase/dehydratase family protein n=1 Tax=Paracoccus sp. TaxID=267 RepID=UPI0026E112BF|nr:GDP-mannose 4,6-dehydratase [Paracoccus sp. (in: a-proteobacteria)]MDO5646995.1 GDP-mannose 4,6-dehydratase [Paracoccus sp. (in: a-proteobacteria)]